MQNGTVELRLADLLNHSSSVNWSPPMTHEEQQELAMIAPISFAVNIDIDCRKLARKWNKAFEAANNNK